eukprot:CAMPEP_0174378732 /NCGR_PEP_ID=MMETSP0811_2-20130205/122235_1 /TAXON_ID=73025 ORGANISM="Eutreptiella gymnastica-like, Strain CCMP1594" /NCGR_SAMPLE_ID=MMETSP0811_2 /ASSEMBLY_ACC=CAM_ASM_000667 /LENGTH=55 /DNA_ID=CAMNT_0015531021 /DNA_START=1394 /DNA_END=1561 /DNA_ORIENTATION=+
MAPMPQMSLPEPNGVNRTTIGRRALQPVVPETRLCVTRPAAKKRQKAEHMQNLSM